MKVIGLTGGIGTGKSTVSSYLKEKEFAIVDADQIAREITAPGEPLLKELSEAFGTSLILQDGSLDRKALADIVFMNKEKKKKLDRMMHSRIIAEIENQVREYKRGAYRGIILDVPLLFETGLEKMCDETWLLTADRQVRIERVCLRDGASPADVERRIQNQMDDEEKKKRADKILDNSGERDVLLMQVDSLIQEMQEV